MKAESAERLLYKIMGWNNPEETKNAYADLHALAVSGYDHYGQFRPGMRFVESLALWLNQFPADKRDIAYRFVKNNLLFVTEAQMKQIVSIAYIDYVTPILIEQVAKESLGCISPWKTTKMYNSDEFKILHDQCLFTGMSDGAHIDDFRRSNTRINHEQVSRTHEINRARTDKIKNKLNDRLKKYLSNSPKQYFRNVFLIDDFAASGTTYLRENNDEPNGINGKIGSFYNSIKDPEDPMHKLVDCDDLRIYVILYIATENVIRKLNKIGKEKLKPIPFEVIPIHILPESIGFNEQDDPEFSELIKEFGCANLEQNLHLAQGNIEKPYLGFNQCALPLILYHNTPNNSLPILRRNDDKDTFKGLFPRIDRHQ